MREKLVVCGEIAAHPQTADALSSGYKKEKGIFLARMRKIAVLGLHQGEEDLPELIPILKCICPACRPGITEPLLQLCQKEPVLMDHMLRDEQTALALALLDRIIQKQYTKQFDLPKLLTGLIPHSPLASIQNVKFYQKYSELCREIIQGHLLPALDQMTGMLAVRQVPYGLETFLQLYLTLAALNQQVPAFLFGKEQLALRYFQTGRIQECEAILSELSDMGMEDTETTAFLRDALTS